MPYAARRALATKSGGNLLRKYHSASLPPVFNSIYRNNRCDASTTSLQQEDRPMWTKPSFTDLRLGFEVTLYFANR